MRKAQIALLLVLLPCVLPRLRHPLPALKLDDFNVYLTAAHLVREGQSPAMYTGVDGAKGAVNYASIGIDYAAANTEFARAARAIGVPEVRLYVYPPILADVLVPFSWMGTLAAGHVWTGLNLVFLAATVALLAGLLEIPVLSLGSLAMLAGLYCSQPVISCVAWGQITLFLLLLWTAGIYCYRRGMILGSAAIFALATAIKLTPLIVIVPMLIWREWKWMRAYVIALVLLVAAMCAINGPAVVAGYVRDVMPSISHPLPSDTNESLVSGVQALYVGLRGGTLFPLTMPIPHGVASLGKLLSAAVMLVAVVAVFRAGRRLGMGERMLALAIFAMLSAPVAPVSWPHAYVVCLAGFCFLWAEALREQVSNGWLLLLTVASLVVGSALVIVAMSHAAHHRHMDVQIGVLSLLSPSVVVVLALSRVLAVRAHAPSARLQLRPWLM